MEERIAVIGLGYVGLPIALAFARRFPGTVGFDVSVRRVESLRSGADATREVDEDVCGPVLEKASGLARGVGFKLGYSPERINPGDREHSFEKIVKVVSGE